MPDNPARFYTRLPEGAVRCDLCPRRCVITPGGAGWCRMRCNAAGELHALSYARPAAAADPESGTVRELNRGKHFIGKKVVEEAGEVWMAAEYEGREKTAEEISQLLYHLQVMMIANDLELEDVYRYL